MGDRIFTRYKEVAVMGSTKQQLLKALNGAWGWYHSKGCSVAEHRWLIINQRNHVDIV